ncbi:MAG: carbohydrate ABC transporter permease [Oscillospiraceae bacterium]|nr:carbohydrate ABC transporter permease [Oscillospiraceae bacterium]
MDWFYIIAAGIAAAIQIPWTVVTIFRVRDKKANPWALIVIWIVVPFLVYWLSFILGVFIAVFSLVWQLLNIIYGKKPKAGDWMIAFICTLIIVVCILPLINILARSLSDAEALMRSEVFLWPKGWNFDAYKRVLSDAKFTWALAWTAFLTVAGVVLSIFITTIAAYPLIYDNLKGRAVINTAIIFTMYFGAGTIPMYILLNDLNMLDTWPVLLVPYCLSVFNMIIMRSFFYGIPDSLRESAEIDGAGPVRVLVSIYIPLSTSVIATLSLFYAVGRWNSYTDALYFISNKTYFPIQLLLYNLLKSLQSIDPAQEVVRTPGLSETLRMAAVMFATVPILLIYPWLQRYFVAGVTLGSEKG